MRRGGEQQKRKSYYVKKHVLTGRDAILLHLLDYHGVLWPGNLPYGVSQEGVSDAVEGHRGHVSRILRDLIREGLIYQDVGRVETLPTRVKGYHITEDGAQAALGIQENVRTTTVQVVGEAEPTTLANLERRYAGRSRLLELARHTVRNSFDPSQFEKWLASREEFVDQTKRMPVLRHLFGRAEELDAIGEWYADESTTTLALRGIPGIGKTALVARFLEERKGLAHVFWFTTDEQSSFPNLLKALADFDSAMGAHALAAYIRKERHPGIQESLCLLERELRGRKALLVIDDVQKAGERTVAFLRGLIESLPGFAGPKIVLAGRAIPKLYDRRRAEVKERVREIEVGGLDEEGGTRFLESKGIPKGSVPAILEATKGHPYFLALLEEGTDSVKGNFHRYLREEVSRGLSRSGMAALRVASIYRTPVFGHGLFLDDHVSSSDVRAHVERGLLARTLNGQYELHDLLREVFHASLSEEERVRYHHGAAEYYRVLGDPDSALEAIFHLLNAGEGVDAIGLAVARGREILAAGVSSELLALLDWLLDQQPEGEDLAELLLVTGEASFHTGDWDASLASYQRALSVSEETANEYKAAEALRRVGLIHLERSEHELANDFLMASLEVSRRVKDLLGLANTYYELANLHNRTGPYSKVRRFLDMSLKWAERSRDRTAVGKALFAMGSAERTYGKDPQEALQLERRALDLFEEDGAVYHMARALHGMGHCLEGLDRKNEAVVAYRRCLELMEKAGNITGRASGLMTLAGLFLSEEKWQEAKPLLDKASAVFFRLGNRRHVAYLHLNYAGLYAIPGQFQESMKHLDRCLQEFESLGEWADLSAALTYKGQLLTHYGMTDRAAAAFKEALASSARIGDDRTRARILRQARAVQSGKESVDLRVLTAS